MDNQNSNTQDIGSIGTPSNTQPKKQSVPGKLPSKPISFSNHPNIKNGKKLKTSVDKSKKSGHLMKKLTGK